MKTYEQFKTKEVLSFETEKGSIYTYDSNGNTTRFKKTTNEKCDTQDLTVFVKFNDSNELEDFSNAGFRKIYVIDKFGNKYNTNKQVKGKDVRLAIVDSNTNKVLQLAIVSLEPKIGYTVFDQRRFEKNEEQFRQIHLGHKVTKINYK